MILEKTRILVVVKKNLPLIIFDKFRKLSASKLAEWVSQAWKKGPETIMEHF